MKAVRLHAYGEPERVVVCEDVPDVGTPGPGEVVFDVLAFPINPADLSFCRGRYRLRPPLPATPGAECVGRVAEVGTGVAGVRPGDLVINLQRENWAQRRRVPANQVIVMPPGIDLAQAAMCRINPLTARLLLEDFVDLQPGDWIVQNVANSAVGRQVIALAKRRGLRTLNIVRRRDVMPALQALGADVCVLDTDDLAATVDAAPVGGPVRLALDAVAGPATARLASLVRERGVLCVYGSMSLADSAIATTDLVYRGVVLTGFMLGRHLARRSDAQVRALYADVAAAIATGELRVPVGAVYPIEAIADAVRHSLAPGHDGKILVAPNGPL